jgi:hypothetical protein
MIQQDRPAATPETGDAFNQTLEAFICTAR